MLIQDSHVIVAQFILAIIIILFIFICIIALFLGNYGEKKGNYLQEYVPKKQKKQKKKPSVRKILS